MFCDLAIIGTGPAGLSAGLYAGRYKLKTKIFGAVLGGAMAEAWQMENYPGFIQISGLELAKKMKAQVEKLGVEIIQEEVVKIQKKSTKDANKPIFQITPRSGQDLESRAVILALGTQRKKLNIPGEEKFLGHGVSYCATCDAPFFKNKTVAVVGGGDAACTAALLLSQHASLVYLLVRGEELKGEPVNIENVKKNEKIRIFYKTEAKEIGGQENVESLILNNDQQLSVEGVFIEIGATPVSALIEKLQIEVDQKGYIKVDENQRTNLPFVYAAGDITNAMGGFKQSITAAAQGALAATSAYRDLTSS